VADFSADQRTNIRMSKLARAMGSVTAQTNWKRMAQVLFRADPHLDRQEKIRALLFPNCPLQPGEASDSSYGTDEFQSILILMLVISIAEKRTQELYQKEFSRRCDEISTKYGLKDDQYWDEGKAPAEWEELSAKFEQQSLAILVQTLREYGQTAIADLVNTDGAEEFFCLIGSLKGQFMKVLDTFHPEAAEDRTELKQASLPEALKQS
jgi:hypothetical protein